MNTRLKFASIDSEPVVHWLNRFEAALTSGSAPDLISLFGDEAHWRDTLAFSWGFISHDSPDVIVRNLLRFNARARAHNFEIAKGRTPPRIVRRLGVEVIEAIFSFETDQTRCHGLVRFPIEFPEKAWVLGTSLTEIKGHEEPIDKRRPTGSAYSRNFGGANWSDLRAKENAFEGREPTVLIVGGSQFGVTLGARLRLLGVDTLVVERNRSVGDCWRNRYHSLALHNQVAINHFPYIPFPPSWPKYLPKDMAADFIEFFTKAMEVNVWTSSTFVGASFDKEARRWSARVCKADGSERTFHPKHLVFAVGVLGPKKMPSAPGLEDFEGEVVHSEDYYSGEGYAGKRVLVLGAGVSGHDVAQDLHGHGASVKLIQRGSTTVFSVEAACFNNTVHYEEDLPIDDADLIGVAPTFRLLERGYQMNVKRMKEHDKAIIEGLLAKRFKLDFGPNEAGHQMKLRTRFGGYYLNCGCSDLIISGEVGLIPWEDADRFVPEGLRMKDGRIEKADVLIAATGYATLEEYVRQLLGEEISEKIGPIWGLDDKGELRNMFVPTAQYGLWFLGGGLSQNRVYSKYVALQIKARELGLHGLDK
jgi:cation diffusion facilitator CzcD-associated flavoprotein CzcO